MAIHRGRGYLISKPTFPICKARGARGFGELDELVLAYTTTIRKAQGVVIPLTTQHYPMLRRNLVYTGVTRGRRLVVIVGRCCHVWTWGNRGAGVRVR